MLGNLVKHEFRATARIIPLFYLAIIATAIPAVIFNKLDYHVMTIVFSSLLIFAANALLYGVIIYLVIRFYKGVYGAEGYLTMTLPADENQILLSRGIVAFAWTAVSSVCFILTFHYAFRGIMLVSADSTEDANIAISMFGGDFMWFLLFCTLIGCPALLAQVYMCVTIAHVRPFRKLGLGSAVLAYIATYFIQQLVSLPLTLFFPFSISFSPETGWGFSNTPMFTSLNNIFLLSSSGGNGTAEATTINYGIASIFVAVAMLIACPIITSRMMKKNINIR